MALIEQAIFTSAQTDRSDGYQIVAVSSGVCEKDTKSLAIWGPSHGSLMDDSRDAVSINFHQLPSGAYCVSRTTAAGSEYSGRGGVRVYTHSLIVPSDVMTRFANNPFAIVRAAMANGAMDVHEEIPKQLDSFQLVGRSPVVDSALLMQLVENIDADRLAAFVQAATTVDRLVLVGSSAEGVIAGLFNCLPIECRTNFSFTTGLKYSSRRPFRLGVGPTDDVQQRRMRNRYGVTVLDLSIELPDEFGLAGWSRFIQRVLETGRTSFLATRFSKRRFELKEEDLPALGLQLLEEMDDLGISATRQNDNDSEPKDSTGLQRAHAAHRRFHGDSTSQVNTSTREQEAPSTRLKPSSVEMCDKLELLDDLVFEAMEGKLDALEQLDKTWPELREELGDDVLAESRDQYLIQALSIWDDSVEPSGVRNPTRAVQALNVLCILFDGV